MLPRIVLARTVLRTKVNPAMSVRVTVWAPEAAIDTRAQTQSVNVPPAKQ